MRIRTNHHIPKETDVFEEAQKLNLDIDKVLEAQYLNRNKYNIFKRRSIQKKYRKAVEDALEEKYRNASTKID